jgi:uncharacterized RDD family membrane protein YckC
MLPGASLHHRFPQIHYAGFWIRFAAYLIDFVLVQLAAFIVGVILGVIVYGLGTAASDRRSIGFVMGLVVAISYNIGMLAAFGWTLGMRILGLRVTDGNSFGPLGLGKATVRYLASILSGLLFGFGYLKIGWDPEKRALHDQMVNTWVVYRKSIPGNDVSFGSSNPQPMGAVLQPGRRTVSPDGRFEWDGARWTPVQSPPLPPPPATPILSPDGRYEWDGQQWAPR